jgi:hypothetical protein
LVLLLLVVLLLLHPPPLLLLVVAAGVLATAAAQNQPAGRRQVFFEVINLLVVKQNAVSLSYAPTNQQSYAQHTHMRPVFVQQQCRPPADHCCQVSSGEPQPQLDLQQATGAAAETATADSRQEAQDGHEKSTKLLGREGHSVLVFW